MKKIPFVFPMLLAASAPVAFAVSPTHSTTLGVALNTQPKYSGSDQYVTSVLPFVQVVRGTFFVDTSKGVGFHFQSPSGFYIEPSLGFRFGRADKDSSWRDGSDHLQGMGNIKATVNSALAVGVEVAPWLTLELSGSAPLNDSQGANYKASVNTGLQLSPIDVVTLNYAALFGDQRYNQTYYGVSSSQSQRTDFSMYKTSGGLYGQNVELDWYHNLSQNWATTTTLSYTYLESKVNDSPIVDQKNKVNGVVAISYTF